MTYKKAIIKAINDYHPKYRVVKLEDVDIVDAGFLYDVKSMNIALTITPRKRKLIK